MRKYRVAIIEDDADYSAYLSECLGKYSIEKGVSFGIKTFTKGESFLDNYRQVYDLVFLDIDLGKGFLNGMETAEKLRALDSMVLLIFVTNMPQYAPDGYNVNALDYCLKPINYSNLSVKLDKALKVLSNRKGTPVKIKDKKGTRILSSTDIMYIEVMGHDLIFHTIDETIESYGGLSEREAELSDSGFARCSASVLVNLSYIKGLYGDEIAVGEELIRIGRSKKKAFLARLNSFLGG